MKILYDHQAFSGQKYGGVSRYFCELMKNLPSEHQFELSLISTENHYIQKNKNKFRKMNFLPEKNFKGKGTILKKLHSLNQYYSIHLIKTNNFDLFHPTSYDNYFLNKLKKPFIITVHDLINIKFKDTFNIDDEIGFQMRRLINKANRIIAISENTKNDLVEFLNINPDKIDIIHHGYNKKNNDLFTKKVTNSFDKYILFVGARSQYKNFKPLAEAISKLMKTEMNLKLICVGRPFNYEENLLLSKLGIADQTKALYVNDDTLNDLYSNALLFVYPSLYEGFGMPILEAFANNCPVCLSNTSCFPEIAGNAGSYFDPNDQESILFAVKNVIYNNNYAEELVLAGQERLKSFSWGKAAKETISSYYKAI